MIDPLSPSANQPLGHHQPLGARALGVLDLAYFFPDGLPDVESLAEEATPTAEHPLINRTATSENSPPENILSTSDHPLASINSPVQNVPSALAATSESSRIQREDSPEPEHSEPRNILPASESDLVNRQSEPEDIPSISGLTSENIPIQKQSSSESVLPPLTSPQDTSLEDPLYAQSNTEAQSTPGTKNHALPGHDLLPVVIDFSTPPAPLQPQRATEGTLSSPTEPGLDMVPDSNPACSAPLQPNQVPENHNSFPTESSPENLESSIDSKIENHPDALNRTDSPKPLSQPDQVSPEIIQRFSENPIAALPISETPSERLDIKTSAAPFNNETTSQSSLSKPTVQRSGAIHPTAPTNPISGNTSNALNPEIRPRAKDLLTNTIQSAKNSSATFAADAIFPPTADSLDPNILPKPGKTLPANIQRSDKVSPVFNENSTPNPIADSPKPETLPRIETTSFEPVQHTDRINSVVSQNPKTLLTTEESSIENIQRSSKSRSPYSSDTTSESTTDSLSLDNSQSSGETWPQPIQRFNASNSDLSSDAISASTTEPLREENLLIPNPDPNPNPNQKNPIPNPESRRVEVSSPIDVEGKQVEFNIISGNTEPQNIQRSSDDNSDLSSDATSAPTADSPSLENSQKPGETWPQSVQRSNANNSSPTPDTTSASTTEPPREENSLIPNPNQKNPIPNPEIHRGEISSPIDTRGKQTGFDIIPGDTEPQNIQRSSDNISDLLSDAISAPIADSPSLDNSQSSRETWPPPVQKSNARNSDVSSDVTSDVTSASMAEHSRTESPLIANLNQRNSISNPEIRRGEVSSPIDAGGKQTGFDIIPGDTEPQNIQRSSDNISDLSSDATSAPTTDSPSLDNVQRPGETWPQSIQKTSDDNSDPLSNATSISPTDFPGIENPSIFREAGTQNIQRLSDAASILPSNATSMSPTDSLSPEDSLIANEEKVSPEIIQKSNESNVDALINATSASIMSPPSSEDSPSIDQVFSGSIQEERNNDPSSLADLSSTSATGFLSPETPSNTEYSSPEQIQRSREDNSIFPPGSPESSLNPEILPKGEARPSEVIQRANKENPVTSVDQAPESSIDSLNSKVSPRIEVSSPKKIQRAGEDDFTLPEYSVSTPAADSPIPENSQTSSQNAETALPQNIQKLSEDTSPFSADSIALSKANVTPVLNTDLTAPEVPGKIQELSTASIQSTGESSTHFVGDPPLTSTTNSLSSDTFPKSEESIPETIQRFGENEVTLSSDSLSSADFPTYEVDPISEELQKSEAALPESIQAASESHPGVDPIPEDLQESEAAFPESIQAASESHPESAADFISTPTVDPLISRNLPQSETSSSETIQRTQDDSLASSSDILSTSDSDSSSSEVSPKTFDPSNPVPSDEFIPALSTDFLSSDNLSVPRTLSPEDIQRSIEPGLSLFSDSKPETLEASFSSETPSGSNEILLDSIQLSSDTYLSPKDNKILLDDIQSSNDSFPEFRAEAISSPIEDSLTIGSLKISEEVQPDIVQKSGEDNRLFPSDTISEPTVDLVLKQTVTDVKSSLTESIQKSGENKFTPVESIVSEPTTESLNDDILTRVETSSPSSVHEESVQKVHESHLTFLSPTASEFTSDPIGSETQSKTQPRAEELVHEHIQRSIGHDLISAPDTISGSLANATRTEITPIVQGTASNPTSTSSKEILSSEILPRSEEETPERIQNSSDSSPTSSTYSTSLSEALSPTVEVSPTSEALQKAGPTLPEIIQTSSEGNSPFLTDPISVPITESLNTETLLRAEISSSNVFQGHGENSPNILADSTSTSVGNDPIPKVLSSSDELLTGNIQRSSETHITDPKDPRTTEDFQQSETLPSIRNLVPGNIQKSSEHSDNYLADETVKLPEVSQTPKNLVRTETISSSRYQKDEEKGADFLADSSSESTASSLDSELSSGTSNVSPASVQRFDDTHSVGSLTPGVQVISGGEFSEPIQRSSHDSPSFPVESLSATSLSATSLSAAKADILNSEVLADTREILPENTQTPDEVNSKASPSYEVLSRAKEILSGSEQGLPEHIQRANERSSDSPANELSESTADSLSPDHLCQSDGVYSELGGLTAQAEDPPTVVYAPSDGTLSDSLLVNDPEAKSHAARQIDITTLGEQSVDPQLLNSNSVQRDIDQKAIYLSQTGPNQTDFLGNPLRHQGQGDYEQLPIVVDFQSSPEPLQRKSEIGAVSGHSRDGLEPSIQLPSQAEVLPKEKDVDLLQIQDELGDYSLTSHLPQDGHARDNFSQLSPTSNHGPQQPLPRDEANNAGNASPSLPITLSRVDDVQIQHPQEPETFSPQFAHDIPIQRTEAPRAEASQSSEVSEIGKVVIQPPEEAMSDTSQLLGLSSSQSPRSPHPKSLSPRERDFEDSFRLPSPRGRGVGGEGGIVAKEHVCELLRLDEVSTSYTEKPRPESHPPSAIDAVPIQRTETTTSYFSKPTDVNMAQVQSWDQPVPDWVKDPKMESELIQRSDANDLSELPTEWQSLADLVASQTQSSSPSTALPNVPQPEADAPAEATTSFLTPLLTSPMTSSTAPPIESLTERPKAPLIAPPGGLSTTPIPPIQRKLTVSRTKPIMKARNQPSIQAQHSGEISPSMPRFLIQAKEETPFTTIEANQSQEGDNHSKRAHALEQLAQEIYQRMRQRLVIEKERHGRLYPKRLR